MQHKHWISVADSRTRPQLGNRKRIRQAMENHCWNQSRCSNMGTCLLNGQGTEPLCQMRYGRIPLRQNGCELIAVCNVMLLCGRPQSLPDLIYAFECNRMHYLFPSGIWGTNPVRLKRYFDAQGVQYQYSRKEPVFLANASMETVSCGIVSFWNHRRSVHPYNWFGGGLHTVAFCRKKGAYWVYNRYSEDIAPRRYTALSALLEDRRFIVGYWM